MSTGGRLCRSHSQGRETCRPAGAGANQIRADHQSQDREGPWSRRAGHIARPRRRGDRMMKRREFIMLLGGAAASWPLVAGAQQGERMRRVGVLAPTAPDDAEAQTRFAALRQGLQRFGWIEGRNLQINARWGAGDAGAVGSAATELAALAPDVIVASGSAAAAILQATRTVPIVFVSVPDPVGSGFVESLAQPGGNATGFIMF